MNENQAPQGGEISPEEAERLAERLKPSWEVEAPIPQADAFSQAAQAPAPPAAIPAPPQHISPAQAVPTQPAPALGEPAPMPVAPVVGIPAAAPAAPTTVNAAARAKLSRTVLGVAPPASLGDPGASDSGLAPDAYPVAAAPVASSASHVGEGALPSVVLSEPAAYPPAVISPPAAGGARFPASSPSYSDIDYELPFRRPNRAPLLIGLVVLVGGAVGAYVLMGPGRAPSPPPAAPVVTATAPPPPPVLAVPIPPVPVPQPAAASAPAPTIAVPPEPAAKVREAPPAKGSVGASPVDENAAAAKPRDVAAAPRNVAPVQPRPAPIKPVVPPKPAPPNRPSGGIVRDVPF